MKCFYFNNLDGLCAGAIVNKFREGKAVKECQFIEMEYTKDFPLDLIEKDERIYIVDFHVRNDDFRKLQEITQNITLIDHHKSAVKHRKEYPELYASIETIIDESHSACWLTWKYFSKLEQLMAAYFDEKAVVVFPKVVKLIDMIEKMNSYQPTAKVWEDLLRQED